MPAPQCATPGRRLRELSTTRAIVVVVAVALVTLGILVCGRAPAMVDTASSCDAPAAGDSHDSYPRWLPKPIVK